MCSIAGMVRISSFAARSSNVRKQTQESEAKVSPRLAVERMVAVLDHRGPDDSGIANFELRNEDSKTAGKESQFEVQVSLGNTRLAVIDLSAAGHQPMHDKDSGLTITYNGEVYNFQEIRTELAREFGPWCSNTDTEVVLRAYRKWGTAAFARLRGMFALAIWDQNKGELVLARDAFGIKPLYYSTKVDGFHHRGTENTEAAQRPKFAIRNSQFAIRSFVFASEVRALLASGLVPRKLDREGLKSYLKYGSVQAPLSIINDVRLLSPGNFLRLRASAGVLQTEERSYLQSRTSSGQRPTSKVQSPMSDSQHSEFLPQNQSSRLQEETLDLGLWSLDAEVPRSRSDAVVVLREKLKESLRAHLVSDVPLAVFLSGVMDSSALVALMNEVSAESPKTFTVVFDEQKFSEAPHSRMVAERFKTDHREVRLTEECLLEMLPRAIASLDQPTMDGINTYVVSRAAKESGITVALSGLGGDELFAGYPTFRRALRMQTVSPLAKKLLASASGIGHAALSGSVQRQKFWQLAASDGTPEAVYAVTRQLFASDHVQCLLENSNHQNIERDEFPYSAKSAIRNPRFEIPKDPINETSRLELQGYMANTLLRDTDCTSMAHSLEVRVPFVDAEVVPYVLNLPGKWKLNGFNGSRPKPLLADAVGDLFPPGFLQKRKMGFTLPFERWMQSRLCKEISSVLENPNIVSRAGLDAEEVTLLWRRFLHAPRRIGWSRPWSLYVLAKWCEINGI
ncbi:MAG TPA: asparagine synthase-related protein [Pyrinomonadaceae bacterium]|nr:asparagine synthase-related protein [Pyrinomonadaceae bacterium]